MLKCKNSPTLKVAILMLVGFSALGFLNNAQAGGLVSDFKQSSNKNPVQGDVIWIGSILQTSNSTYYEGMSSLQRLVLVGIPKTPGDVHTLTLSHQANKATSHAYDFLTSWPQALQAAHEIGGPTMFVNLNECGPAIGPPADLGAICADLHTSGFTATPDAPDAMGTVLGDDVASKVAAYEAHFGDRTVKIYGNAPISASTVAFDGYSGSGDLTAEYTFSWTSSSDSIVIELAGHLAVSVDPLGAGIGYGEGLGSANISGGPYHFSLSHLDGNSLGSQDNQIKGADILLPRPPVCDVTPPSQAVCVGFDATFTDNSAGGTQPYTYCWQKSPYTDPCVSITNQLAFTPATLANAGDYRVIVTDANGLADTCYATLTVNDQPVCEITGDSIICPGSTTELCATDDPDYEYLWSTAAITRCITVGTEGMYWVAVTDENGCAHTCYLNLTVDDTEPPVALCPDDITVDNEPGQCGAVVFFSIDATDDCPGVSVSSNPISGSFFPVGTTPVEVIATDVSGNADTCYFDVTVNDTEPPVAQCPDDISVDNDPGECDAVVSFTIDATDNCPGVTVAANPVSGSTFPLGTTPVEVIATDASGNADTCYFDITVDESEPPVALCPDDITVDNDPGECGAAVSFTIDATDNCPGVTVTADPPSGSVFSIGFTTVEVVAVDAASNADTCYFDVTVHDTEPPVAQCPDDITRDNDPGQCDAVVSFTIDATDNCPGVTVTADPPSGSVFSIGFTTVEVVAVDAVSNADTCYFDVTVNDTEPPVAECPDDITQGVDTGECTAVVSFSIDATDNCPGVTVTADPPSGSVFSIGFTTVEVVAVDAVSNADTCEFTVTVYNRPPELTCPEDGTLLQKDTFVSTDFSVTDPDGDSAPVTFLDIDPSAANDPVVLGNHIEWITTLAELGDYTIRLVATDPCGLADTCEFTVMVDELTGTFDCPEDDSVHAGVLFTSKLFTLTGPGTDPSLVSVASVDPSPTNMPVVTGSYVEWQTDCLDTGKVFTIRLQAPVPGSEQDLDTCYFEVTVYNRPPELFCPEDGGVSLGDLFVSTDSRTFDPDEDQVQVSILDVDPNPCNNNPYLVLNHLEWQTTYCDSGTFYIRLVGVDPCGLKDTCGFWITTSDDPAPDFYFLVDPVTKYVEAGKTAEYKVELLSLFGFTSPCSLYVSGLPDPPNSADFDQVVVTPTDWTMMNVHTTVATNIGMYTLTITGKEIGGSVEHDVTIFLEVLEPTDVEDPTDNPNAPKSFALLQNQPNPFNPVTQISYQLPQDCRVRVTIYNVRGQRVRTLYDGHQGAGRHTLNWDGRDTGGRPLSSGIYLYRLEAGQFHQTKKMTLMK